MNGIVIVDKPSGWTSQDVAARLRRVYGTRRIGHGGTLDPMATGVLPVFVGRATRAVEFFMHAEKTYEATLRLGVETDTEDITGTVLCERRADVTREALETALARFRGEIAQIPPMYSARKVNGRKLYDLARAGVTVEREARTVSIFALECLDYQPPRAALRVRCSAGTYIRTLCGDIGRALGCGGCMEALRRTQAGAFSISDAVPLETLLASDAPQTCLLPTDTLFQSHPACTLTPKQETRCRNGNPFSVKLPDGVYRAYAQSGEFLMLARVDEGVMSTVKSFFDE